MLGRRMPNADVLLTASTGHWVQWERADFFNSVTTAFVKVGLGQLLHDQPERDDAEAADRVTRDVLIMFGLPADEAAEICRRPLPDLDELTEPGSAA